MKYCVTLACALGCVLGCGQPASDNIHGQNVDMNAESTQDIDARPVPDVGISPNEDLDAQTLRDAGHMDVSVGFDGHQGMFGQDMFGDAASIPADMGRFPDVTDAALNDDMRMAPVPECPMGDEATQCLFGATSRDVLEHDRLHVVPGIRHADAHTLSPLERAQIVYGFGCEGLFSPQTAEAALAMTDNGVETLNIRRVNPTRYFTWHRFYMGDTEVGFIFRQGTMNLVARVSDQDLQTCIETVGDLPPMTCERLSDCLESCQEVDLACRRPCLRASEPDSVEAYISWDECASDCGPDPQCLNQVCADEREACFGP